MDSHMYLKDKIKKYFPAVSILSVFLVLAAGIIIWRSGYFQEKDETQAVSGENVQEEAVSITHLRTCYLEDPLGIDEEKPTFSWRMSGEARGLSQHAYRIMVADSLENLGQEKYIWDSGKIEASESVGIPYAGEALEPKSRYYWQVTVWDQEDIPLTSAEEAFFETGLLGEGMQNARWISAPDDAESIDYTEDDLMYSIHYDVEIKNAAVNFIFGAQKGKYGDMYFCQISSNEEQAFFSLRKMSGGSLAAVNDDSEEIDITDCRVNDHYSYEVELLVDHEILSVIINGSKIGELEIERTPVAAIGYYMVRGNAYAYLDNLSVQDMSGNILYQEDFEAEENIFSPYYVTVENGRLRIGSGMVLTRYYESPAPLFYREFLLQDKEIADARIYMTALGSFSLVCNGQSVSEDYFAPGKIAYNKELTYMTYDVTDLLHQGENNAIGITLLHGWYDRAVGYPEIFNTWGEDNALLGLLEVRYTDGSVDSIVTDEKFWCSTDGAIREDDIYQGEYYDATLEQEGFGEAGFAHDDWQAAETDGIEAAYYDLPLTGKENEPIRCVQELTPLSVSEPCEKVYVYDFGQNFAGTCRINVTGEKGQILTLRYGETLNTGNMENCDDAFGTIWTENLMTAEATDYYVLKGDAQGESFEPAYTYHGFRYLQITGLEEPLSLEDVKGIVLSSDLEQTGTFESSNPLLNQYYANTVWSQRSNFMDNPTDCPQRDERHGWAGDAQVFSLTASYHMGTYNFYRKYLQELMLLQTEEGAFSDIAPRNFFTGWSGTGGSSGNNCWGDAAMVITWNLYTQYGSKRILEENYDALCRWVDYLTDTSEDYIRYRGGYGDHLSFENTPAEVSDTAWCAHCADLLSRMATILDKQEDAEYYRQIYENYKAAWQNAFVQEEGITICDTQTSYALGLYFDLFPEDMKEDAAARLDLLAQYSEHHIKTGYSGIGYLLPALSENGLVQIAYEYLLQEEYPSLLYMAKEGATTMYESLFAYSENEEGLIYIYGSLNHCAFGAAASWLYTDALGIKSDEMAPGYHHIILEPKVSDALTYAKGSYESVYGQIQVSWEKQENGYVFDITIPANTTATLTLPVPAGGGTCREGGQLIEEVSDIEVLESSDAVMRLELGSGSYCFTYEEKIF
ncbi:MAG: glycoside hydrolase family 78 protein [Roseburia sp.]|nr:glycoside hydrolase family 78 protein [Roseburia sp.]MCM1243910.1 glycoside hydrolase family 78 protein [Roseburia sp.]